MGRWGVRMGERREDWGWVVAVLEVRCCVFFFWGGGES